MRIWFEALSRRDQVALLVLGGALVAWLFIQVVVIELDGRRRAFGSCQSITVRAAGTR